MHLQIRAAISDDAQLIADMTRAAWAGKVAATSSGHRETAMLVSDQLGQGGGFILLIDDQPAGSVRWLPSDGKSDGWEILRMGLLPDFRGNDLSRKLLEAVFHHALANEVCELRLAVRTDQPRLLDLYSTYGFEIASDLTYSHANPSEPAPIVMRKRL
ncbi:MAG TPA: GNAT family N-acetyltransferase [Burkholderiaceae bacterium]|jgi:GNAT superfamily N-acetyltransferase